MFAELTVLWIRVPYRNCTPFRFLRRNLKRSCEVTPIGMGSLEVTPHPPLAVSRRLETSLRASIPVGSAAAT